MSATVKRIVLKTPDAVGTVGQYSALVQCRQAAAQARADGSQAVEARTSAQESAVVALTARDQAVAAVGAVKVTEQDFTASTLDSALLASAPLTKAVQNPGGDESLLLGVAAMTGATADTAGTPGVVQAPAGAQAKFLRGDATWRTIDKAAVGLANVADEAQIAQSIGTAKGDVIVFTASGAPSRLAVGTDGQALVADSSQASGVKWATPATGGQSWADAGTVITRVSDSEFTVTDNATNQDLFRPGRPIRFRQNNTTSWMYAMVSGYATGTVTIGGAAYTSTIGSDSGRGMQYGDMARLHAETFVFHGSFADGADSTLIADDLLAQLTWQKGKAYCVKFLARPKVDDSGAAQSRVNVKLGGNAVTTTNGNAGLAMNDAAWTETVVDIATANYTVEYGQTVEVSVDGNGTNKDARDLTLTVLFVLE